MEASGQSGAAAADGGQAQGGEAQQGEAQGFDASGITEQLSQLGQQLGETREFLMSEPWRQQEQQAFDDARQYEYGGDQQLPPLDLGDLGLESTGDPEVDQQAALGLQQWMQQQVQAQVQQQLAPQQQQLGQFLMTQSANELATEFPELQNPETARGVIDGTAELANALGVSVDSPNFFRLAKVYYLAARAADAANDEEGAETPAVAGLEGGAGAGPGGGQQVTGQDFLEAISGSENGLGSRVLPFQ